MKNKLLLIIFIIISLLLAGYIVYDKVDNKNLSQDNTEFPAINIEILSMDEPTIDTTRPNEKLIVSGKMNISYDENIYSVVVLSGYCRGENGESYDVYGPIWGKVSFNNGDTEYNMGNVIPQVEPDWSSVKIKSCRITSAIAYISSEDENTGLSTTTYTISKVINYEKTF